MRNAGVFDRYSKEERAELISTWSAEKLLEGYKAYYIGFNPLDFDVADTFDLIRAEIIKRCTKEAEKNDN